MSNILLGTVKNSKNKKFYFTFDKSTNIIVIQPIKMEKYYTGFFETDFLKYPEFRKLSKLVGVTNYNNYIVFFNLKFIGIGRGCFKAWVPGYILGLTNAIDPIPKCNNIKEIIFSGKALDMFFRPKRIISEKIDNENKKVNISVDYGNDTIIESNFNNTILKFVPKWEMSYKNEINVVLNARAILSVNSNKSLNLDKIIDTYLAVDKLLCFTNYRRNICFDEILLYEDINVNTFGMVSREKAKYELHIANNNKEIDLPSYENVIVIDDIIEKLPILMKNIIDDKFILLSLPYNKSDSSIIDNEKYANVSATFESEMLKLFDDFKSQLSKEFKIAKEKTIEFLDKEIDNREEYNSKTRKYFVKIKKEVNAIDGRLDEKVKYALDEFDFLLVNDKEYYKNKWNMKNINNLELASAFADKRNALLHGIVLEEFTKNEIISYILVKKINYAILLKRSGFNNNEIIKIIDRIL